MKKLLAVLGCLVFSAMPQAQAAVLTYEFTAKVGAIGLNTGDPWGSSTWLSETEGPNGGPLVKTGQHIFGKFSFDTSAKPSSIWGQGSDNVFYNYTVNIPSSYSIAENGTHFSGSTTFSLADRSPDHFFGEDELVINSDSDSGSFQLRFSDRSHLLFAAGLPTTTLSLDNLSRATISDAWWRSDNTLVSFKVNLSSLTLVQAQAQVPEPASWGWMLAGLCALGFGMRRRPV